MTELGKVTQFETEVVTLDGKKSIQLVTRVGGFNLVSEGQILKFPRRSRPNCGTSQATGEAFYSLH